MKNYVTEDCHDGILPSDLFRLDKNYDQIMEDHILIRQMKIFLERSVLHGYITHYPFEELIKEAYFQCGIIQRRLCCHNYYDYWRVFINRYRPIRGLSDNDRIMIVGGMVYLLLFTRKNTVPGTAIIIDEIWKNVKHELDLCFSPANPFEDLLSLTELHEIDFGIHPLPIDAGLWEDVYWGNIERKVEGEDNSYKDCFEDYHRMLDGTFDENAYCRKYINTVQSILDTIGFKTEQEQLKLLEMIIKKDLYYVCEEKIPLNMTPCPECEYHYECVEGETYNRLKLKSIEDMKLAVMTRYADTQQKVSTIQSIQEGKKKGKAKKRDFRQYITKPEKEECILNRLHELIDRLETTQKMKPLSAAIKAGAISENVPLAVFVAEFGNYKKSTYYYYIKSEHWEGNGREGADFKLLVSEFKKMVR